MKKILFLLICVAFTSCVQTAYIVRPTYIDFSKYQNEGFYINSLTNVTFDYSNLGLIQVVIRDGEVRVDGKDMSSKYDSNKEFKDYINAEKKYKYATYEDALDVMVKICRERGSNGIIDLKLIDLPKTDGRNGGVLLKAIAIKK